MTYQEAVDYIEETPKFTQKHTLSHTRECLKRLGNPQDAFRVIHVAGTNGKGSTCAFLDSILRSQGYSCGLFTSPHLIEITERFKINGNDASEELFLWAFHQVYDLSVALEKSGEGHPTYFEMLFLMGMLIFKKAEVSFVVLETGLGGRLDATTAVENPMLCIITSISRDHMQYLGGTIAEIAGEKAGILVPGVPVIYDGNDPEAAKVIEKEAKETGSPSLSVKKDEAHVFDVSVNGIDFVIPSLSGERWHIPFLAEYQVMNAMLALRAVEQLRRSVDISDEALHLGLERAKWPGRMEPVLPGVIVDGAHNEDGVVKFVETAKHYQRDYSLGLFFSAVEDKDYRDMIRTILSQISFSYVVTTQVGGYRQVDANLLAEIFREYGADHVVAVEDTTEAFEKALTMRAEDGMLFCVGSLYLVGEVKEVIEREKHD